ncbi:MAG: uncharacterized protein JWP87_524 [Labilithrix sp.]|nr:uncharacterized protein [Labilithrix sp.]
MSTWRTAALVFALASTVATGAHAEPTKEQCVDAYKKNQQLRREGALREAIKELLVCARDPCPAVLQTDCVEWLRDANARLPSIVVKAHSAAASDLSDVSVTIDGAPLVARIDGRAIDVDAGAHTFVFAHPGSPSVEKKLLVVEGEKARVVDVDFAPSAALTREPGEVRRPVPWTFYALGGFGLAALGVGATFGSLGLAGRSDLSMCSGSRCPQDRDAVAQKFLVADISYAAGAVSLVAATILFLTRPYESPP